MKYSFMSLMVDDELKHEKTNFIMKGMLESMGCKDVPEDADEAYRMLNERGIPMKNGTAGFEDLVRFTKEHGFDGLDLMSFQAELTGAEMKKILDRYGVVLSAFNIIAPFSLAGSQEAFEAVCRDVFADIDKAAEAGAKSILLVPAGYGLAEGQTREQCFENMIRGLRSGVAHGEEMGIAISTETLESIAIPFCSIGEMKRIFAEVPGLKYTHDTGNPLVANEDPLFMYQLFREKTISVHFKDLGIAEPSAQSYLRNNGESLALTPLGTGLVDFSAHLRLLAQNHYEGYITLEGSLPAKDKWEASIAALNYFRNLEAECCKDL